MNHKWLRPEHYLAPETMGHQDRLCEAQWNDAEHRSLGICSIRLDTGWAGRAQQIIMTLNQGLESERTITLSREQTAALVPILLFEARWAVQDHAADLRDDIIRHFGLHRCPTCGLGPFGNEVRSLPNECRNAGR